LFLLGSFCRRLDALAHGPLGRGVPALLGDLSAAIASGTLRASMDAIPAGRQLQLDVLLELVRIRVERDYLPPRLRETLNAFAGGLGIATGATAEEQVARYSQAHALYYAPFFVRHPHILENCLANTILRGLFPFGERSLDPAATLEPALEFVQLATLFAVIKGLLIGVAGFHREMFSAVHVVQTVQTAFRHFDHCPEFLGHAVELLAARNLNNAAGLTMLLRD
jgi:lysine-N-methylase